MTELTVKQFIAGLKDEKLKRESQALLDLMQTTTGAEPEMWGANIIGFGTHHYKYETGREGDTVAVGFSPRKTALVLYGVVYYNQNLEEVKNLGTFKLGKGCLYIKKLADVDVTLLQTLIAKAYKLRSNSL